MLLSTNQGKLESVSKKHQLSLFYFRFDEGYITWVNNKQLAWTLLGPALRPNSKTEIGSRSISQEPMVLFPPSTKYTTNKRLSHPLQYIIANLGLSLGFGEVDFDHLVFPAVMKIDYIRAYQDPDALNIGCDPKDFPTAAYINT